MDSLPTVDRSQTRRWALRSLLAAGAALIACIIGAYFDPAQFFRAYLAAYLFFWGLAMGSLVLLMVYHLTGGAWGYLIRRLLEAQMKTLPLIALLFIPIGFGAEFLYVWATEDLPPSYKNLVRLQPYLNVPFFASRAAFFFVVWSLMAWLLARWSAQQDESDDPRLAVRSAALSGVGLVIYGLTLHVASVDWLMSIQTLYHASIIGPLVAAGQVLSSYALALLLFALVAGPVVQSAYFSRSAMNDLGSLLLTLLVVWCYTVWFWFSLTWIANEPSEVIWFLPRLSEGWHWMVWVLVILNVLVPFFLLLLQAVKQRPALLGSVAGLIVLMHLLFIEHQVLPAYDTQGIGDHWMAFLTPIAIGGIWISVVLWLLARRPLLVTYEANSHRASRLRDFDEEAAAREEELAHGS